MNNAGTFHRTKFRKKLQVLHFPMQFSSESVRKGLKWPITWGCLQVLEMSVTESVLREIEARWFWLVTRVKAIASFALGTLVERAWNCFNHYQDIQVSGLCCQVGNSNTYLAGNTSFFWVYFKFCSNWLRIERQALKFPRQAVRWSSGLDSPWRTEGSSQEESACGFDDIYFTCRPLSSFNGRRKSSISWKQEALFAPQGLQTSARTPWLFMWYALRSWSRGGYEIDISLELFLRVPLEALVVSLGFPESYEADFLWRPAVALR